MEIVLDGKFVLNNNSSRVSHLVHSMDQTRCKYDQHKTGQQLQDDPVQPHVDAEQHVRPRKLGYLQHDWVIIVCTHYRPLQNSKCYRTGRCLSGDVWPGSHERSSSAGSGREEQLKQRAASNSQRMILFNLLVSISLIYLEELYTKFVQKSKQNNFSCFQTCP